jgi:dTDP-4-dehydrorhamnose reductase
MLGRDLLREGERRGIRMIGRDLPELDVTDDVALGAAIRGLSPEVVVNCAAFTKVDDCEKERDLARRVNGEAVANLAAAADEAGALLVQISTDFVFDGSLRRPLREDDPVGPISEYGRSKLLGEENARRAAEHLVIRTSWLFGVDGWNFVEAIRKQVRAGRSELTVVDDQVGSPTSTVDLSAAICDLVAAGARGVVHFSNAGEVSWRGFAEEIVRIDGKPVRVTPIDSATLGRPAPRPAWSVLDTGRFRELVGHPPRSWQSALADYARSKPD